MTYYTQQTKKNELLEHAKQRLIRMVCLLLMVHVHCRVAVARHDRLYLEHHQPGSKEKRVIIKHTLALEVSTWK